MSKRSGKIINISSVSGEKGGRGQTNYAASKGAVNAFTKALAVELAPRNIRVNAVAPGVIETDMSKAVREMAGDEALQRILLKRYGTATEVAQCAQKLANEFSLRDLVSPGFFSDRILSNDISSISELVFGPDRSDAAKTVGVTAPRFGAAALAGRAIGSVPTGAEKLAVKTTSAGTPYAVSAGYPTFAGSTVGKLAAKAFTLATAGKLFFDAEIYLIAVAICAAE
jgi:hypothetical protein